MQPWDPYEVPRRTFSLSQGHPPSCLLARTGLGMWDLARINLFVIALEVERNKMMLVANIRAKKGKGHKRGPEMNIVEQNILRLRYWETTQPHGLWRPILETVTTLWDPGVYGEALLI